MHDDCDIYVSTGVEEAYIIFVALAAMLRDSDISRCALAKDLSKEQWATAYRICRRLKDAIDNDAERVLT